jgi:hypothetical protein
MSKTTTKYSVNQFKQIIPLNENIVNFELNFDIQSENNLPFKAVVLSEDELNSENPINYQDVTNGVINGNIVNDKGVYQLYYLLLKADQPVDCNLTLDIKEIPINPEIVRMQQEEINKQRENMLNIQRQQQLELKQQQFEAERKNKEIEQKRLQELQQKEKERQEIGKRQLIKKVQEKEESKTNFMLIFVIIGIAAFGIWFLFFNNKKKKNPILNLNDGNKVEVPKIKDIDSILKIENPKLEIMTELPKLEVPKIEVPKIEVPLELPKIEVPLELPKIETVLELPKIEMSTTSRRNSNLLNRLNSYFDN